MGYLKSTTVELGDEVFEITELSYRMFQQVTSDEDDGQLLAIQAGCPEFAEMSLEELGELPTRLIVGISTAIASLCMPEDAAGN